MRRAKSLYKPIFGPERAKKRPRDHRGFTLAEALVGAVVAGMLFGAIFWVYRNAASAFMKGDTLTHLRHATLTGSQKLSRDLERSVYDSLSVSPDARAISFLTALDPNGEFQFDAITQQARWQAYLIYYYEAAGGAAPERSLKRRRVSVVGTPQETAPTPIESFGAAQPLSSYLSGGDPVALELDFCEFLVELSPSGEPLIRARLRAEKKRYGSERLESFELETVTHLRN